MASNSIEVDSVVTEIMLGCKTCPNKRILKFNRVAASMLTGTDTTEVPIRIVESIEFKNTVNSLRLATIINTCEGVECGFTERIGEVSDSLIARDRTASIPLKEADIK